MVSNVHNCPVTIEDILNNNTIYGCDVPNLKGKNSPSTIQAHPIRIKIGTGQVARKDWKSDS